MIHKIVENLCQNSASYSNFEFTFFGHYKNPGIDPSMMSCQVYQNKNYQFEVSILERHEDIRYQLLIDESNGISSSISFSSEEKIEKYIREKYPDVYRYLQKKSLEML